MYWLAVSEQAVAGKFQRWIDKMLRETRKSIEIKTRFPILGTSNPVGFFVL